MEEEEEKEKGKKSHGDDAEIGCVRRGKGVLGGRIRLSTQVCSTTVHTGKKSSKSSHQLLTFCLGHR